MPWTDDHGCIRHIAIRRLAARLYRKCFEGIRGKGEGNMSTEIEKKTKEKKERKYS